MINIKTNKIVNFLMILYQISKNQNNFPGLKEHLVDYSIDDEDRENIKKILRSKEKAEDILLNKNQLNKIYQKNKEFWEAYWSNHLEILENICKQIKKRLEEFDMNKLKQTERFFEVKFLNEINVYLCMGNKGVAGTGNAFSPNICILFPRKFKEHNKETIDSDFAVLIHEIIHLYLCDENKDLTEHIIKAFAPKGILIQREKVKSGSTQEKIIMIIEKALKENKTYKEIKQELKKNWERL